MNIQSNKHSCNAISIFISTFLCVVSFVLAGFSFSQTNEAQTNAFANIVTNTFIGNSHDRVYTLSSINSNSDGKTKVKSLYQSTYINNFSRYFTEMLTYIDDNNALCSFDLSNDYISISDYKIGDFNMYTNSISTKRFETCNINLFKTPNKDEELNTFNYVNGIAYIPDYLADQIISSSQGTLKCYNDLIPDLSSKTELERNAFLDRFALRVKNHDGDYGKYKIANIFHVKGFNEKYEYNDDGSGKILYDFLSEFIVVVNGGRIEGKYKNALISCYTNKKMINYEQFKIIKSFANDSIIADFYYKVSSSKYEINEYCSLKAAELISFSTNRSIVAPLSIISFIMFVCFVVLNIKHIPICRSFVSTKKLFLIYLLPFFIISLIFQLLYLTIFKFNFMFLIFYNILFNVFLLLPFVFYLVIIFKRARRKINV